MIKKEFCFPEYYINKVPMCDDCNCVLNATGIVYTVYPQLYEYKCDKCGKLYKFNESELQGEWKWRTI